MGRLPLLFFVVDDVVFGLNRPSRAAGDLWWVCLAIKLSIHGRLVHVLFALVFLFSPAVANYHGDPWEGKGHAHHDGGQ